MNLNYQTSYFIGLGWNPPKSFESLYVKLWNCWQVCVTCHYKGYCAIGLARCQYDFNKPENPKKYRMGMHPSLLDSEKGRVPECFKRTLEEQHHSWSPEFFELSVSNVISGQTYFKTLKIIFQKWYLGAHWLKVRKHRKKEMVTLNGGLLSCRVWSSLGLWYRLALFDNTNNLRGYVL